MAEAFAAPAKEARVIEKCVEQTMARAAEYLEVARHYGSPLYLLEPEVLRQRARVFRAAFAAVLPGVGVYYALKSNNLDAVVTTLVEEGLGVDVSSGIELQQALAAGATDIIFSGPGKTAAELGAAISASEHVVVLADSAAELERLQVLAAARDVRVRAGARLSTAHCGVWRKFGTPLGELGRLLEIAATHSHIRFEGLQYHMSWSLDPERQVAFIRSVGDELAGLPRAQRDMVRFLDIGGGFWPPEGEWLHADPAALLSGSTGAQDTVRESAAMSAGNAAQRAKDGRNAVPRPRILEASGIDDFAASIGEAVLEHVFPWVDCRIHIEPGRWLCNDAMHILITVVDKKAEDLVIVDAGTNAIGWERFESDYFPLVNLSRPGLEERVCTVFGSLCTPHDVWGFSYHGAGIEPGDVLLVPRQGAYTYSLRQNFIKPLPDLVIRGPRGWSPESAHMAMEHARPSTARNP